jgi:hypothetical protein
MVGEDRTEPHHGASETSGNGAGETLDLRQRVHVTPCATGRHRHHAMEGPADTAHHAA